MLENVTFWVILDINIVEDKKFSNIEGEEDRKTYRVLCTHYVIGSNGTEHMVENERIERVRSQLSLTAELGTVSKWGS